MDIAVMAELITSLGFPIALVVAMGFFIWKIYEQSVKREEKLMIVNEQALNTLAIYAERLEIIQDDVKTIKEKLYGE